MFRAFALTLFSAACFYALVVHSQQKFVARSDVQQTRLERLRDAGKELAKEPCAVPIQTTEKALPNPYDPGRPDLLRTVTCPGVDIEILQRKVEGKTFQIPYTVRLTNSQRQLPLQVSIGADARVPQKLFGAPDNVEPNLVHYYVHNEGPGADGMTFYTKDRKVQRIVWTFHAE